MKAKLKTGDEYDAFGKNYQLDGWRTGQRGRIKRRFNRRQRHEATGRRRGHRRVVAEHVDDDVATGGAGAPRGNAFAAPAGTATGAATNEPPKPRYGDSTSVR